MALFGTSIVGNLPIMRPATTSAGGTALTFDAVSTTEVSLSTVDDGVVYCMSSALCHITIHASTVATVNALPLPANTPVLFAFKKGDQISVRGNAGSGTLWAVPMVRNQDV